MRYIETRTDNFVLLVTANRNIVPNAPKTMKPTQKSPRFSGKGPNIVPVSIAVADLSIIEASRYSRRRRTSYKLEGRE